jgi:uncharacterized SAM-binding protein YcdF (DUF218 family)
MFVISKLFTFVLFPFTWVVVLLIWALLTKNPKRKQRILVIDAIVLYLFSAPLLLGQFQHLWDYDRTSINTSTSYSCVIVLGGYASENKGTQQGYFNSAADRFIQGIELYTTGKAKHILLTGGNSSIMPDGFREATWVSNEVKKLNIPDSAVIQENQSRNTLEDASFSKKILEQQHLTPPYLLVTSAFHMRRALLIFKKAGINVVPYPAAFSGDGSHVSIDSFIPDGGTLSGWGTYTKELVGYVVAWLHK